MKYKELQDRIKQLEQELWFKSQDIKSAHDELDRLGVEDISKEYGHANVSHRLQWLSKRLSKQDGQDKAIDKLPSVAPSEDHNDMVPRSYRHKLPITM